MLNPNELSGTELFSHVQEVANGNRRFENAAQAVSRMILEKPPEKIIHAGKTVYDYPFFREGKKHVVGWYEELNEIVHFIKDAAEGGSSKEMALVLVSEPGSGKTFALDYLCKRYRQFLAKPGNRKYTFKFVDLDKALGYDPKVSVMHSLTFEDPMVLAMNLSEDLDEVREFLAGMGFTEERIAEMLNARRPLGASTEYIWYALLDHYEGNIAQALGHVAVIPVPMRESLGTTTGKYSAKDKITSSSVDLLGEESLQHLLLLGLGDPNKFDLRRGALARVAGSGIHFSDELFRNKKDLVQIYLQVIQNRQIELDGFVWPIDCLIVATSNNDAYNQFVSEKEEAPIKDRCRIVYVTHNTDYRLQQELTSYSMGSGKKTTIMGRPLHHDPNLNYAVSALVVLTRLIRSDKLNPIEMLKLAAGEVAGEKDMQTLVEVQETANAHQDVTKRWGQRGLGHRDLGRILQLLAAMPESNEGECLFAKDVFRAAKRVIDDYVSEATDHEKYLQDLQISRRLYRSWMKASIFNAYMENPYAIRMAVMSYVNMIIGLGAANLGPNKMWHYNDPQSGEVKGLKIDETYIKSVETRLGLSNEETRKAFRDNIRHVYGQRIPLDPNYDFMDNQRLVKAVTEVRLDSEVAGADSLVGALANRNNEENLKLYNRMVKTMFEQLGYCPTCAQKTIEYYIEKDDES